MPSIHFTKFRDALKELNPAITFDDGFQHLYPGIKQGDRMGIKYLYTHVCNCDTGDMPEFNEFGDVGNAMMPIHPDDREFTTDMTQQILFQVETPMFQELTLQLGKKTLDVVTLGGHPVMAERVMADTVDGTQDHAILARVYFRPMQLPHAEIRIGWRATIKRLLDANIPGVTKQALEEKLGVTINTDRTTEKTLEEIVKDAGVVG